MQRPLGAVPNGAHMEIGTYGDLATMHWVQNEPWAADLLPCDVTYGAWPCPPFFNDKFFVQKTLALILPTVGNASPADLT